MKRFKIALALTLCLSLFACSGDQILTDIDLALQMSGNIASAVAAVSPADAAAIQTATNVAVTGLQAVQLAYDTYEKSGATTDLQKLEAVSNALKSNLANELAAAHVTNQESTIKVTAWVNLINTSLDAVLELVPQMKASNPMTLMGDSIYDGTGMAAFAKSSSSVPQPKDLKARWEKEVCRGDKKCAKSIKVRKVKK